MSARALASSLIVTTVLLRSALCGLLGGSQNSNASFADAMQKSTLISLAELYSTCIFPARKECGVHMQDPLYPMGHDQPNLPAVGRTNVVNSGGYHGEQRHSVDDQGQLGFFYGLIPS